MGIDGPPTRRGAGVLVCGMKKRSLTSLWMIVWCWRIVIRGLHGQGVVGVPGLINPLISALLVSLDTRGGQRRICSIVILRKALKTNIQRGYLLITLHLVPIVTPFSNSAYLCTVAAYNTVYFRINYIPNLSLVLVGLLPSL